MNDERDFERRVTSVFDGTAPSRGPDDLLEDVFAVTGSRRPRPRWWARLTEKPMRYDRTLVSGSPTARTAVLLAATMLLLVALAGAAIAGARAVFAGTTYVVAQDGSGDFVTITEAIAAADDRDTVLVRAGTYAEDLVIRSGITLRGDGPRGDVVIAAAGDGMRAIVGQGTPAERTLPVAVDIRMADPVLEGFVVRGVQSLVGIRVNGGSPSLRDLEISIDDPLDGSFAVLLAGGSSTTLVGLKTNDPLHLQEASSMTLERSELLASVEAQGPGRVAVSGNHFGSGSGFFASDAATGEVSGNAFEGSAIVIESESLFDVRDNTIRDVIGTAITVSHEGTRADIEGNDIRGSSTGVAIGPDTAVRLADNTICDNETNVFESSSATTEIHQNEISATCPDPR